MHVAKTGIKGARWKKLGARGHYAEAWDEASYFSIKWKWKCHSLSPVWLCNPMGWSLPVSSVHVNPMGWSLPVSSVHVNPMDWSLPVSSVHGIFQARILEWVAMISRGSSPPRDLTRSPALQADSLLFESLGKLPFSVHHHHMTITQLDNLGSNN